MPKVLAKAYFQDVLLDSSQRIQSALKEKFTEEKERGACKTTKQIKVVFRRITQEVFEKEVTIRHGGFMHRHLSKGRDWHLTYEKIRASLTDEFSLRLSDLPGAEQAHIPNLSMSPLPEKFQIAGMSQAVATAVRAAIQKEMEGFWKCLKPERWYVKDVLNEIEPAMEKALMGSKADVLDDIQSQFAKIESDVITLLSDAADAPIHQIAGEIQALKENQEKNLEEKNRLKKELKTFLREQLTDIQTDLLALQQDAKQLA